MQRVLLLPTFFFLVSAVLGTLAVVHAESMILARFTGPPRLL